MYVYANFGAIAVFFMSVFTAFLFFKKRLAFSHKNLYSPVVRFPGSSGLSYVQTNLQNLKIC